MRPLIVLLASLFLQSPVFGQIFDRALGYGMHSNPQLLRPLDDDRWLVASTEGSDFAQGDNKLFLRVIDQEGQVTAEFPLASAVTPFGCSFEDALPTPDGGFVAAFSCSLCDIVPIGPSAVKKIGPDGQTLWQLVPGDTDILPDRLALAPDGGLLGVNRMSVQGHFVRKYDPATGLLLESAVIAPVNAVDLAFIPGTEDLVVLCYNRVEWWQKTPGPGAPAYALAASVPVPGFNHWWKKIRVDEDGRMWFYDGNAQVFYRITGTGEVEATDIVPPFEVEDYTPTPQGLLVTGRQGETNYLVEYSPDGGVLADYPMPDRWRSGRLVAFRGKEIALAGTEGSGPAAFTQHFFPPYMETNHLWTRTLTADDAQPGSPDVYNAGVSDVHQQGPVTESLVTYIDTPLILHTLYGGQFQVEVTNSGSTVLNEVAVNIRFGTLVEIEDACYAYPTHHRRYDNLQLAPGASAWLDFGDILAPAQEGLPQQFCFWTSAPNTRPDANHADDHFCHPVVYTLGAAETATAAARLYPNPASDEVYLDWPDGTDLPTRYELFDPAGRLVASSRIDAGSGPLKISIAGLPDGFYWFKAGSWRGKLAVRR